MEDVYCRCMLLIKYLNISLERLVVQTIAVVCSSVFLPDVQFPTRFNPTLQAATQYNF